MTAVFDYGPLDDLTKGFQVQYSSRFTNSAGGVKELYYSNGGMIDMDKQTVTPTGGLTAKEAAEMKMQAEPACRAFRWWKSRKRCRPTPTLRSAEGRPADHREHAQLDGVRALTQDAEREYRGGLQPLCCAVHECGGDPDRAEGYVRREDAAGDGGRQGLCVGACFAWRLVVGLLWRWLRWRRAGAGGTPWYEGRRGDDERGGSIEWTSRSMASRLPRICGPPISGSRCCIR